MELDDEILIGNDALKKTNDETYEVIWPIIEGRLQFNHRTPKTIQADLQELWKRIIETYCKLPATEFYKYKVMLLVPDQFLKRHVKVMIDVLLTDLGFSSVFIHQESVCAAIGAGLSSACVVDIGHGKTAISCIDDGISISRSR
jgi:actin-related protein 8